MLRIIIRIRAAAVMIAVDRTVAAVVVAEIAAGAVVVIVVVEAAEINWKAV